MHTARGCQPPDVKKVIYTPAVTDDETLGTNNRCIEDTHHTVMANGHNMVRGDTTNTKRKGFTREDGLGASDRLFREHSSSDVRVL